MTLKHAREVAANVARADASLRAARELASGGYYDFAASRAYYAAFYGATALLLAEELEFRKHSGVISAIHQRFVKAGKLEERHGKDLNWLFELRGVGDYGCAMHVSQQDADRAIVAAEAFVRAMTTLIRQASE